MPRRGEHSEVSKHLLKIWLLLRDSGKSFSNNEIASMTGVSPRTARAHTRYLCDLGLLDVYETFPGHLYRLSDAAEKRNQGAYQRLNDIADLLQSRIDG